LALFEPLLDAAVSRILGALLKAAHVALLTAFGFEIAFYLGECKDGYNGAFPRSHIAADDTAAAGQGASIVHRRGPYRFVYSFYRYRYCRICKQSIQEAFIIHGTGLWS
jgi:hypothetical protein